MLSTWAPGPLLHKRTFPPTAYFLHHCNMSPDSPQQPLVPALDDLASAKGENKRLVLW